MNRITTVGEIEDLGFCLLNEIFENLIPVLTMSKEEFNELMKSISGGMINPHTFDINGINNYNSQSGITFKIIIE